MSVRTAIASLKDLTPEANLPIIDVLRPWMVITGLDFKDAIHCSYQDLVSALCLIYEKLGDSTDIFDEESLQEAACRCLNKITVYGEPMKEGFVQVTPSIDLVWDGNSWIFITDPKMRSQGIATRYKEALQEVQNSLLQ